MAYQFNGSNQYLSSGSSSIFQVGIGFTLSAIVNPANLTGYKSIACYYGNPNTSDTGWVFRVFGSQLNFGWYSGSEFPFYNFGTLAANANQLCTLTHNGSSFKLYINNSSSNAQSSVVAGYSSPVFTIGCLFYSGSPVQVMNGLISELGIWNVVLTDAEIASLAAGFTPDQIRPQSLQFYAPLVRDLIDVRGGRAITNVNGATVSTHPRIYT